MTRVSTKKASLESDLLPTARRERDVDNYIQHQRVNTAHNSKRDDEALTAHASIVPVRGHEPLVVCSLHLSYPLAAHPPSNDTLPHIKRVDGCDNVKRIIGSNLPFQYVMDVGRKLISIG